MSWLRKYRKMNGDDDDDDDHDDDHDDHDHDHDDDDDFLNKLRINCSFLPLICSALKSFL